jgi:hypothetical protein
MPEVAIDRGQRAMKVLEIRQKNGDGLLHGRNEVKH